MDPILNVPKVLEQQQNEWNIEEKNTLQQHGDESSVSPSLFEPEISKNKNKNKNKKKFSSDLSRRKKQKDSNRKNREETRKQKQKQTESNLYPISMMNYLSNLDVNKCTICKQMKVDLLNVHTNFAIIDFMSYVHGLMANILQCPSIMIMIMIMTRIQILVRGHLWILMS